MRRIKYGHLTLSGVFLDKVIPNNDFHDEAANLVTFTEEILNGKLHFLCSESILEESILIFR